MAGPSSDSRSKVGGGKLITEGLYTYTRNPNYLGRLMVYASLSMLCGSAVAPWAAIPLKWVPIFVPGMLQKDLDLSRKRGFVDYRGRTGILFPKVGPIVKDALRWARCLPGGCEA